MVLLYPYGHESNSMLHYQTLLVTYINAFKTPFSTNFESSKLEHFVEIF